MIGSSTLLSDLQKALDRLVDDLRQRVDTEPLVGDPLRAEHERAFAAERTGLSFTAWAEDRLTQVAVGWLLGCVFVRFCEDNGLIDDASIAGIGARGEEARLAQRDFFSANPHASDRDYLHHVFRSAAALPGLGGVLGEDHSALWLVDPSADACTDLVSLWRRTDDTGALIADFTDPARDTRFLGDLYQDLSEHAKKTYALLQTPVFVEEFILDRTLEPAIEAVGLADTSIIDPTCGSGHFLLGAFDRLWQRWAEAEPADSLEVRTAKALDAVWGVDLNPFAASIARFRLLVAAMAKCNQTRLADARDFPIHVTVGDSLLWGAAQDELFTGAGTADNIHLYATEDASALRATFDRTYSAVVGNPPYITVKDKALNAAYRQRYKSCHRQYSLGVPFSELFFQLAQRPDAATGRPAGFVGLITANSFMKREFGKKLIEDYIPTWDLAHVVDTSGAYIPGHGTPTVILYGRNQRPVAETIRTVMGIRGEPSTPDDPAKGLVWSAIVDQIDTPGSESDYISVSDTDRSRFATHPWSTGGGGAAELKEQIEASAEARLSVSIKEIGRTTHTGEDEAYLLPEPALRTRGLGAMLVPLVIGEDVRDYLVQPGTAAAFPYDDCGIPLSAPPASFYKLAWPLRTNLRARLNFGETNEERGLEWWEYSMFFRERFRTPLSIAFAFVATHNHFVLDRGGKVFNRSAPVIKLPEGSTVDDHLGLLALLNSSVACFWMKQVYFPKGGDSVGTEGARIRKTWWDERYEFDGTKLQQFPLPEGNRPVGYGQRLDELAQHLAAQQPAAVGEQMTPTRERLERAQAEADRLFAEMVAAQEELDWHCLWLYGLTDEPLTVPDGQQAPPLALAERAFEIVLARKVAAGEVETTWFTRHGSTPVAGLPEHWPAWYRDLVARRIELIESDRNVGLVERPEHKRRWNRTSWDKLEDETLRDWLLDRLEDRVLWFEGDRAVVRTVPQLADRVSGDVEWMEVARLWAGVVDVDPLTVVTDLVADEHVPAQAAARYKPSGLKKRAEWERTWDLQRAEDRGEDVGRIAVPPRYASADFAATSFWRQRGKLDVPKERFVSVHGADRDGRSGPAALVLAWAGFDHAQLAQALATLLHQRQTADGWTGEQLLPLIVALDEVVPWVEQWHPEVDPSIGQPLGVFYRGQVDQALSGVGATRATLDEWRPPARTRGRRAKTTT